jgi:exodeoxyribonuclease VII small subunit
MTENAPAADLGAISFEDALRELETIVAALEAGNVSLDDAITAFERGTALKTHCQARLEEARMKVEQLRLPVDGSAPDSTAPFGIED